MDENVSNRVNARNPGANHVGKFKKLKFKQLGLILGAIILIGGLVFGGLMYFKSASASIIDTDKYQAVFLSNGQVYFGKLQALNTEYIKLTDIFYLQTKSDTKSGNPQATSTESDVQLIKLGSEVHGPDDQMVISKDQILFFENLKTDGTVSKSIVKYHKQ